MAKPVLFGLLLLAIRTARAQTPVPQFPPGTVIPSVVCQANPQESYALYLPSSFSGSRQWPIIYAFDPGARGRLAVETIQAAAENYGFIVAASNNSRNGSTAGSMQAADAVWRDTQERFPLAEQRRYFAGMSGGARVATQLAIACHGCAAGVIANAAGFPVSGAPANAMKFAYFGAVGYSDFNYPEFANLRKKLEAAGMRYRIRVFDGKHGWAPAEVWDEALRWMDLQAMANGALPRDAARIQQDLDADLVRARGFQAAGSPLEAFRQYEAVVRDFKGLADVSVAASQLEAMRKDKPVKAAEKEEARMIEQQSAQSSGPATQMQAIASGDLGSEDLVHLRNALSLLRKQAAEEAKSRDAQSIVTARVLGGLVVQALESGQDSLARKKYDAALAYFDLAAAGAENPAWGHYQRARIFALMSDKKAMLRELGLASGLHDVSALEAEEFRAYRDSAEFSKIVEAWKTEEHR